MGLATFCATFSQTHLVTLIETQMRYLAFITFCQRNGQIGRQPIADRGFEDIQLHHTNSMGKVVRFYDLITQCVTN
jgi:hypothetical protein